jgi:hypothetical protein
MSVPGERLDLCRTARSRGLKKCRKCSLWRQIRPPCGNRESVGKEVSMRNELFTSTGERQQWERSCAGKAKYPSSRAAEAHADFLHRGKLQLNRMKPRGDWDSVVAYFCRFCHEYHLGHQS